MVQERFRPDDEPAIELVDSFLDEGENDGDDSTTSLGSLFFLPTSRGNYSLVAATAISLQSTEETTRQRRRRRRRRILLYVFLTILVLAVIVWQKPFLIWEWNRIQTAPQNKTSSSTTHQNDDSQSQRSHPTKSPSESPSETPIESTTIRCGCQDCTPDAWNAVAGDENPPVSCGDRVQWLQSHLPLMYPNEVAACRQVAFEYPCECASRCDPARCRLLPPVPLLPSYSTDHFPPPTTPDTNETVDIENPLLSLHDLYCFLDPPDRVNYSLWDNMILQPKQSSPGMVCGPGENEFDASLVTVNAEKDELSLRYVNDPSQGSEVRIVPRFSNATFGYGTYEFSVKSILTKYRANSTETRGTQQEEQNPHLLPPNLILGFFTWDSTEDYPSHENYNHEIDIEIGRWGCRDNADVQFLMQPEGYPHMYRFYSKRDHNGPTFQPAGHTYQFTWTPGRIDWNTSAGGGLGFSFTTAQAVSVHNTTDYIQCASSSSNHLEVRMNLWNSQIDNGDKALDTTWEEVQVVIDKFRYTPSLLVDYLPDGQVCSKDCQCQLQKSACIQNLCKPV